MKRWQWPLRALGFVLFGAVLSTLDVMGILHTLGRATPGPFFLAVVLMAPYLIAKAWRWWVLIRGFGMAVPFEEAVRLYAVGLAAGYLTPGQTGDTVKAVYLKAMGHSLTRGLASVILDRLFDLAVVGGLGLWGIFLYGAFAPGQVGAVALFAVVVLCGIGVFALPGWQAPLGRAIRRLVPPSIAGGHDVSRLVEAMVLRPGTLVTALVITLVSFVVTYTRLWLLFVALHIDLDLTYVIASTSLAGLAALLPISVGGIGTRDATLVILFAMTGHSREEAVALSTLILALNALTWPVGFIAWLWRPLGVTGER
jgi:uncharacterized membrane protein YbhN (UPF0104 family)